MKRIRYLPVLVGTLAFWVSAPADVGTLPAASGAAAGTTTTRSAPGAKLQALRKEGFQHLLAGRFRQGLERLEKLPRGDLSVAKARVLTGRYLERCDETEAERKAGLAAAVARVKLARLAEKHRPRLLKMKLADKLFDQVEVLADSQLAVDRTVEVNPTSQPADLGKRVAGRLDGAAKDLSAAGKLVGGDHGEWGKAFQASVGALRQALDGYRQAWKGASLPEDWRRLKGASEHAQDRLIDLGVLVSRDPLVVGLSHAREAKELSGSDAADLLKEPWMVELIRDAEKRGQELVAKGQWGEALTIYGHGGLSGLDEGNARYEELVKRVSLHVRVVNLYGRNAETKPASTQPATATAPADEPRWREMIAGVDSKMIRYAISQVDRSYVEPPDYRKMGLAALNGIKVLAETPEVAAAFPELKDTRKREAFVAGLDRQSERLRREPAPDHLHVAAALNGVLDLNDRTVNIPPEVLNMEFAETMLEALDRFTGMIWPYEEEDFRKRTMGSFCGVGVQIRKETGGPIEVVTPLADTPAFHAGIRAGDMILAVDGRDTKTISIDRVVKRITGKRGTKVTLTVRRPGTPKPFDVNIVRDVIHIQTVKGWRRLPDGKWDFFIDPEYRIGYVRVTQFTSDTPDEVQQALRFLRNAGAKGVILDVRFNPGGLLNAAVDVADEFLRRGLIVWTKGRNGPKSERSATALGEYQSGKLVVLANQFSASAAEIVSGALKDWHRGVIIGRRTYGKGSVQGLIRLQPKRPAKLKLTTAYYYLPAGGCLHRTNGAETWGVEPDMPVFVTIRQMNRAAEIRQETDLLKSLGPERLSRLLTEQLREDVQLHTALLVLQLQELAKKG